MSWALRPFFTPFKDSLSLVERGTQSLHIISVDNFLWKISTPLLRYLSKGLVDIFGVRNWQGEDKAEKYVISIWFIWCLLHINWVRFLFFFVVGHVSQFGVVIKHFSVLEVDGLLLVCDGLFYLVLWCRAFLHIIIVWHAHHDIVRLFCRK